MRMRFLFLVLLLPVLAQAQLYRWVDESGKVHYSDRAPSAGAKDLQKQSLSAAQGSSIQLPYALQQAVKNFPVALYTSDACKETCAQARQLLDKRGVPYSETTVTDEADLAQLKKISGDTVVPVVTVGREVQKGFESGIYNSALDNAGYPASSLLPPGVQARKPVTKPVKKTVPAAGAEGASAATPPETADSAAPPADTAVPQR